MVRGASRSATRAACSRPVSVRPTPSVHPARTPCALAVECPCRRSRTMATRAHCRRGAAPPGGGSRAAGAGGHNGARDRGQGHLRRWRATPVRRPQRRARGAARATARRATSCGSGSKNPTQAEFDEVNEELQLHPLAVEDAIQGRQRAKVELYDNSVFVVLKPLRYVEQTSDIETGELMCFVGDRFIVTVRRGEAAPLAGLRQRLEAEPHALRRGADGGAARDRRHRRRQLHADRRRGVRRPRRDRDRASSPGPTWTPPRSTGSSARCSSSGAPRRRWPRR